jgi:glycosyltransferase involved in cell wall biosynthesis
MNSISVVMPTYNRAGYIKTALDSIEKQSTKPLEVIVIDDQSTDDTEERVRNHPLCDRLRYHRQSERRGASIARNIGVEMARGDLVVFLDSDDLLESNHHSAALAVMRQDPQVGLFCCDSRLIGSNGELLQGGKTWTSVQCEIKRFRIESGYRTLEEIFLFSTPFPGFTVRRDAYLSVGGLDQGIFPLDDYDLQLKIAASSQKVYYEHRPLALYRIHDGNESGSRRAVRVGRQKLRCLHSALKRYPSLSNLGFSARRRIGGARREKGLSLLKNAEFFNGTVEVLMSLIEDPCGARELLRIGYQKIGASVPWNSR